MTLRYSCQQLTADDEAAVLEVLRSPHLTQGPVVERFEAALAEYVGAKHAVAVSSGTAALHIALLAASRPDRRMLTSPLSFVATATAGLLAEQMVGFADVDPKTGGLPPKAAVTPLDWARREAESSPFALPLEPHVYVPVHYAGRATTLPEPQEGLKVIEDACHALGARHSDGSRVGSCGRSLAAVFSFHPVKPITTGEGGAITTNDEALAREVRLLRSHGRNEAGQMTMLGLNCRMTEMQAALGLSQLRRCDEMRERRAALAWRYGDYLWDAFEPDILDPVAADENSEDPGNGGRAWHLYPVRIKDGRRDAVQAHLNGLGIGAQIHYSPPIHLQPYYRWRFGYEPGAFPEAEAWAAEELSLPLHAGMTDADVERVLGALKEALA